MPTLPQRRHGPTSTASISRALMQAPGAPDKDRDDGFEHGGWTVPLFDEQLGEIVGNWIAKSERTHFGSAQAQMCG